MGVYFSRCSNIRNPFFFDRRHPGLAAGSPPTGFYYRFRTGIRPKCNTSQMGTANNAMAIKRSQVHGR